ncbi:MAG: hypothetical protein ACQESN_10670 [Thermotogota bacterium]
MSNPGVITLFNAIDNKSKFNRFVIEDNIGESIHIHIDNFRIELSIQEFLTLSATIKEALNNIDILPKYQIDDFDLHFFYNRIALYFDLIEEIKIENIPIKELKCSVKGKNKSSLKKIVDTPSYKYLQGNKHDLINYQQFNYFGISNESRLAKLYKSIKNNGYPKNDEYIILFNNENIIRDGQHRAAVLAHLYGLKKKVPVMRFIFSNETPNLIKTDHLQNVDSAFSHKFSKLFKQIYELNNSSLVIYGNGSFGQTIRSLIPNSIVGCVDKSSTKISKNIQKDSVYSPENLSYMVYDKIVISVLGREEEVIQYLTEDLGLSKHKIFYFNL